MTLSFTLLTFAALATPAFAQDGGTLYKEHCASCHNGSIDRAPTPEVLRAMTPQRILEALKFGSIVSMTHGRTTAERRARAEFAAGKPLGERFTIEPAAKAMCRSEGTFSLDPAQPAWNGFGQNLSNTRFQPSRTGLSAADVPRLQLKRAFGLPGDVQSWAALTIAGGRVFVGSIAGNVYSLDARTGCVYCDVTRSAIRVDHYPTR